MNVNDYRNETTAKLVKLDEGTSISSITRVISEETTPEKDSEDQQEVDGEAQVDVEKNEK